MLSLKNVMRLNALSCLLFGALFAVFPGQTAEFLGGNLPAPSWLVLTLGLVLIGNGLHLAWASNLSAPNKLLVFYFSCGDFLWVIASLVLLTGNIWITTNTGIYAAILVAVMVAFFGVMQLVSYFRFRLLNTLH